MAKCRMLIQENQELGRQLSQGRIAQLEAELALQKKYSCELKNSQDGEKITFPIMFTALVMVMVLRTDAIFGNLLIVCNDLKSCEGQIVGSHYRPL